MFYPRTHSDEFSGSSARGAKWRGKGHGTLYAIKSNHPSVPRSHLLTHSSSHFHLTPHYLNHNGRTFQDEAIGGAIESVTGSTEPSSWTTAGKQQHAKGETEVKAAEAEAYAEGMGDRVQGKVDSVVGAATGDKAQQMQGNAQHDKGKLNMQLNS
ncbi:hypothetical protein CcaverHIS631_0704990 [Cutaneotrichosporon cavernicola]|nr:hypothetical protein CcaverHIS631_0704990 [Cutaneotrichosporon cavernicola]BEJ10458.1 hypothetical protein CcaverHIS641_0704930 [Cutaneotrichosporon cavernicola]